MSRSGTQPPWACLVEPQGQWQGHFVTRFLEYVFQLHRELRHGPHDQDRYLMMGGIVDVCDRPLQTEVAWLPPGLGGKGLTASVEVRRVYQESAAGTLDDIEAGRTDLCVLPWVPLMAGGDTSEVVARWRALAERQPDAEMRANSGGLARVFAEKRQRQDVWREGLEGWNVEESMIVKEWQATARAAEVAGSRSALVRLVRTRAGTEPIDDVLQVIEKEMSRNRLLEWVALAAITTSYEVIRDAVLGLPTNGSASS